MDIEEVKKKLRDKQNENQPYVQFSEKEHKNKIVITVAIGVIALIIILGIWSITTTEKPIEGDPEVCFKSGECLDLILAISSEEQEIGYSNYTEYPEGKAMLFVFSEVKVQAMWMKDMDFPIDMIWIDTRNRIGNIAKKAIPCKSKQCLIYEPPVKTKYVLELPSGYAQEYNMFNGDVIEFKNLPSKLS